MPRVGARLLAAALGASWSSRLVLALVVLHVLGWTVILTIARAGGALNSDSTEAYAWGRLWLWGYGKHPPLTGWVARLWFDVLPTADWAMYALAMTVAGVTIWASWLLALRVVDRRRALLVVLLLLVYPVLGFRGSRYNPDLLQVPLFVLAVLVFVIAFQARTLTWGFLLGLVCAGAVLTKYWALLVVGGIGVAAIVHPARADFFRSPCPYAATIAFLVAVAPHLVWLVQSDYAPFAYAAHHLSPRGYSPLAQAATELRHHAALLLPVALTFAWAVLRRPVRPASGRVRLDMARHLWVIATVLLVLPPLLAVASGAYFAVDWGTPLYTLLPLAVVALPQLGIGRRALVRAGCVWGLSLVAGLLAAPVFRIIRIETDPQRYRIDAPDLARQVTKLWRDRQGTPLPVIAGPKIVAAGISFYSREHPVLFTNLDPRLATWIDANELRRTGFVAICPEASAAFCEAAIAAFGPAERVVVTQPQSQHAPGAAALRWSVYLHPPR